MTATSLTSAGPQAPTPKKSTTGPSPQPTLATVAPTWCVETRSIVSDSLLDVRAGCTFLGVHDCQDALPPEVVFMARDDAPLEYREYRWVDATRGRCIPEGYVVVGFSRYRYLHGVVEGGPAGPLFALAVSPPVTFTEDEHL